MLDSSKLRLDPYLPGESEMFRLPGLFVKRHYHALAAKGEVATANLMRLLGHPEVPRHEYHQDENGRHYVVTPEIKGAEHLGDTTRPISSHSQQRMIDLIGAERYVGSKDRHKNNFLVSPHGVLHPIDYGWFGDAPNDLVFHAVYRHMKHPEMYGGRHDYRISPEQADKMRRYLPALGKLWKRFATRDYIPKYVNLQRVLRGPEPPRLSDIK